MGVIYILLFFQVIPAHLVFYQPQNVVSVEVNTAAVISCVSNEDTDKGLLISWYRREWIYGGLPLLVKSCANDKNKHKYTCKYEKDNKHDKSKSDLIISNVQSDDSGVYFCNFELVDHYIFGNGTYLIAGDRSTSSSSIRILAPLPPPLTNSSLQLACVVHEARDAVYITWNISGTHHKGRMTSKKDSYGTWTIINFISLPGDNWNNGENVTCEVWLSSSPISVHWVIPEEEKLHRCLTSYYQGFLISVVIAGFLLLLTLTLHLIRTFKFTDTKTQVPKGNKTVAKDEVVYTELNTAYLTRHRQ